MTWQQLIHSLEQQSKASGSRSDVLRVLIWPGGILATLVPALLFVRAPLWLIVAAATTLFVLIIVYLVAFVFLLITNPDLLRSERFQIEKMAIEKGVYGNSLIAAGDGNAVPKIVSATSNDEPGPAQ